jgi:hypothetical protein
MYVIGKETKSTPESRWQSRLRAERIGDLQLALMTKRALAVYLVIAIAGLVWIHGVFPN